LLGAIYGRIPYRGRISVAGQAVAIDSTRAARKAGIALLTEDRKRSGLLFNLAVRGNITIGNLDLFARHGIVSAEREDNAAVRAMRELNVKARSSAATVAHLSGGNQQKLLFARVLMNAPKILLLDEPTKGVDVGTRHEIYRLIVELAGKGVGLLVVSSELEEVIGLCDRCLVLADGQFVDEFAKADASEERVLRAIAAAQAAKAASLAGEVAAPVTRIALPRSDERGSLTRRPASAGRRRSSSARRVRASSASASTPMPAATSLLRPRSGRRRSSSTRPM
jgi:ribose transport system ATP-binding protein/D-xylose transport system ATP-binding protein